MNYQPTVLSQQKDFNLNESLPQHRLLSVAEDLAQLLKTSQLKVVFAESCTAGLIAATLSKVPGISEFLCGSFVTYRNASKSAWLGVNDDDLQSPETGPVSSTVASQMASGALSKTAEADLAVSVTGHLGPGSPPDLDGIAYSAIQSRTGDVSQVHKIELDEGNEKGQSQQSTLRHHRQIIAALQVLQRLANVLREHREEESS